MFSLHINSDLNNIHEFTILQWIVKSISARSDNLNHLLSSIYDNVAILSETWLFPSRSFNFPGYHIFRHDRKYGYSDTAIAVCQECQFKNINLNNELDYQKNLENLDINVVGVEIFSVFPLQIWFLYIPPQSNITSNITDTIFNLVRTSNAIIVGDFNGHHSAWGSAQGNYRGNLIYSCLSAFNLCLLNNGSHTRINRPLVYIRRWIFILSPLIFFGPLIGQQ